MKNFYKINFLFFFSILLSPFFVSCSESYHWQVSTDGQFYTWTTKTDSFEWSGDSKGNLAHGTGYAYFYDDAQKTKKEKLELFYGAKKDLFESLGNTKDKYIGEYKKNARVKIPDGRGVLLRSNGQVYSGIFSKGYLIKGFHFVNDELQYEGTFENNRYSGYGRYYKNNKVLYEGNWEKGLKSGKGIEYQDNAEFSGNYVNDKREGSFEISRNGTIRLVNYHEGIPDLDNGKICYSDGSVWIGGLTENYEPNGSGQMQESDGFVRLENRVNGEINGYQKIPFSDGSYYEGEIVNGKRNGFGTQQYATGIVYSGNWENDLQTGYGDLVIDDDWYYSGDWKNGLYDGFGSFYFPNFLYEGEWKNGKKNGQGTLVLSNLYYEGSWENDELNGEGFLSFQDGSYYEGSWKNSKRNGYGEYVWADGSTYYGKWEDDFPNGEGEVNLSNGDYYSGEVEYGYFSGNGVYIFANGDRYEGTFVENKREGLGLYYFSNGNSYEGAFKDNKPDGKGRFYFENGSFYEGNFEKGKLKGEGSLYIPEGDDYTIITSSYWSENKIPNTGSVLFANGDEFVGYLENGMPTENGTWTTREERLSKRSTSQKLRDFYGTHQETIETIFSVTEWVITGINFAATIAEFIPFPPVQVVAMAVDKVCDVASCVISGSNIAIKTAVLNYDVNELKQNNGSSEEIADLKKQYAKDISGDVINIAATVTFASIQAVKAGVKAKKAVEMYPKLAKISKTIENTGELAKVAKSGKFKDKLVRGTVKLAYGKVGKKLIKAYGDDAAKMLFKYGDNALYALTSGADAVFRIAQKGGDKALKVIFDNGEDAIKILSKNLDNLDDVAELIAKKGKAGIKLLEAADSAAPNIAKQFAKHGDDFFEMVQKLGTKNIQKLAEELTSDYFDDVLEILLKVQKENPKKLKKALQYIEAKGIDALHDIKKWNGKIPDSLTAEMIRLAKKRYKGAIKAAVDAIKQLPALKLSTKEMDQIRKTPDYLKELVKKYTGKSFKDGYKEFFLRLAKKNKNQIEEIWNYSSDVRNVVKEAIRNGGGKHEWLMCENFCSFLTDPKWGRDGSYLAYLVDQLATDTSSVIMSNGWSHFAETMATLGNSKNPRSVIHNGIRQIIKEANNADDLLLKLKKWISENFTQDAYDAFEEVLNLCIK